MIGEAVERETGIEPATNGLGSRDSTTELLPLAFENEPALTAIGIAGLRSRWPKVTNEV